MSENIGRGCAEHEKKLLWLRILTTLGDYFQVCKIDFFDTILRCVPDSWIQEANKVCA